jgi:hypothetical protein
VQHVQATKAKKATPRTPPTLPPRTPPTKAPIWVPRQFSKQVGSPAHVLLQLF